MMRKRIKQGGAIILAAVLVFSVFVIPKVYAAIAVGTDKTCSVQIIAPAEGFRELQALPVVVNLYKVAEISADGTYTTVDAFAELDFSDIDFKTNAKTWEEKALGAKAQITEETEVTASIALSEGTATAEGLSVGLYLVDAQQTLSDYNQYDFKPYLISLPNNYFYTSGNDDWVYDLVGENAIGLKPEKTDRYGNLMIDKTLDVFNETIGGATFVFQVEAFKKDVDTIYAEGEKGRRVYSNVVSMTFHGPGTDSIMIEEIPAGAEVTVTEIYSGASYELTSDANRTVTIIADGEEGAPATAAFTNTYNKELNGGNGVVNSFSYNSEDKSWTHSAAEDSTP